MIWVRRFLAVILIPIFIVSLVVVMVANRVNGTVLSANFYVKELRKADVFNFAYDKAIPAAVDDWAKDNKSTTVDSKVIKDRLLPSAKEVLPPDWLEKQSEQVILQVVPYMTGEADSFAINIPVKDRVQTLGDVLKRELGSQDNYNLVFDQIVSPALDQAFKGGDMGNLPYGITVTSQDVVGAVKEIFPYSWVGIRVNGVVDQAVPYLTGDAQHFTITMPVSDRIQVAEPVVKKLLVRSKAYQIMYSQDFANAVDKQLKNFGELPFGMTLTSQQLVKALQDLVPPDWLQARVESLLDAGVPYLSGTSQTFQVAVPVKDRVQVAGPVAKRLLQDANAYNALFDQVILQMVQKNIGEMKDLPLGITVTSDDISTLLKQALPPSFLQAQTETMIDQLVPYLTGDAQSFKVVIPLGDRKAAAIQAIQGLVDQKLREAAAKIPACTAKEALDLVQKGFTGALPPCLPKGYTTQEVAQALGIPVPPGGITWAQIQAALGVDVSLLRDGVTPDTLKASLKIDVAGQVSQFIGNAIPNDFTFTDVDLRKALGPENEKLLDNALKYTRNGFVVCDTKTTAAGCNFGLRDALGADDQKTLDKFLGYTRNGFTYTDADLRNDLGPKNTKTLDKVLGYTRDGFTYTDADLRDQISKSQDGQKTLDQIDQARKYVGIGKKLAPLAYLLPLLLLAAIGFLGGRSWRSRVAWAAVPLIIAAAIAYIAFGPVYNALLKPILDNGFTDATEGATGVSLLMIQKGTSVAQTAINDFLSGLTIRALLFLMVGVVALVLAIFWPKVSRLWRREQPAAQPPSAQTPA